MIFDFSLSTKLDLSILTQVLSIGTLMLPVVGTAVRWTGFLLSGVVPLYTRLAVAAPVGELALTGAPTVVTTTVAVLMIVLLYRNARRSRLQAITERLNSYTKLVGAGALIRRHQAAIIACVFVLVGAGWGRIYHGEQAGYYTFSASANLAPGWYARVGTVDDDVFLIPCAHSTGGPVMVEAPQATVVGVTWRAVAPTSIADILVPGLQPDCP